MDDELIRLLCDAAITVYRKRARSGIALRHDRALWQRLENAGRHGYETGADGKCIHCGRRDEQRNFGAHKPAPAPAAKPAAA